jgi:glutamate synthase domain-containing protein 3
MTNGTVVILGTTSFNIGAGMTGGEVFITKGSERFINGEYVTAAPLNASAEERLRAILEDYLEGTESSTAKGVLAQWETLRHEFRWLLPNKVAAQMRAEAEGASGAAA